MTQTPSHPLEISPANGSALGWLAEKWSLTNGHENGDDEAGIDKLVQSLSCGDATFVPLVGSPDYRQAARLRELASQNPDLAGLLNRVATALVYAVRLYGSCEERS